jgi:hypothetical protein
MGVVVVREEVRMGFVFNLIATPFPGDFVEIPLEALVERVVHRPVIVRQNILSCMVRIQDSLLQSTW